MRVPRSLLPSTVTACFCLVLCSPTTTASNESASDKANTKVEIKSKDSEASEKQMLKGTLKFNSLRAEEELNAMSSRTRDLRKLALMLGNEASRVEMAHSVSPNAFGSTVLPAVPQPTSMMKTGISLPARKHMVNAMIFEMSKLVNHLYRHTNAIASAAQRSEDTLATWNEIHYLTQDITKRYNTLVETSKLPDYKNIDIGKQAVYIHDDTIALEKLIATFSKSLPKPPGK